MSNSDSQKMLRAVAQQARIDYTDEAGSLLAEVVYEHEFPLPALRAYLRLKQAGFSDEEILGMKKFMTRWRVQRAFQRNIRIQDIETEIGIHAQMTKPNHIDNADPWEMINEAIWSKIFARGTVGVITGVMGSGKTDMGLLFAELLLKQGIRIISNIKLFEDVEGYYYKTTLTDIVKTMSIDKEHDYLLLIDETGISANKKDAMTAKNKRLEAITRIIRKLHASMIVIDQTYSTIPTLVQEVHKFRVDKHSKTIAEITSKTDNYKFKKTVRYIPRTKLPFDTDDIAHISMDLDVQAALDYMSESEKDQRDAILEFIKMQEKEKEKEKEKNKPDPMTMDELKELASHVIFRIENGEKHLRSREALEKEYQGKLLYKDIRALFQLVRSQMS